MMLKDLVERYRSLQTWVRLLICSIAGILPGVYLHFFEFQETKLLREQAQVDRDTAYRKLQADETKVRNIKQLEEQKAFTEQQLKKARQFLPENYDMESILHQSASIAKDMNIEFKLFEPKKETLIKAAFPYNERRIAVVLVGTYQQIASYFDRIVYLEPSIHIKSVEMNRDLSAVVARPGGPQIAEGSDYERALKARQNHKVIARTEFVVYRAQSAAVDEQVKGSHEKGSPDDATVKSNKEKKS